MENTRDEIRLTRLPPECGVGFRVKELESYWLDVVQRFHNWRLVATDKPGGLTYSAGYCYFGLGTESLARAVLAAVQWDGPGHGSPPGFDKRVC